MLHKFVSLFKLALARRTRRVLVPVKARGEHCGPCERRRSKKSVNETDGRQMRSVHAIVFRNTLGPGIPATDLIRGGKGRRQEINKYIYSPISSLLRPHDPERLSTVGKFRQSPVKTAVAPGRAPVRHSVAVEAAGDFC